MFTGCRDLPSRQSPFVVVGWGPSQKHQSDVIGSPDLLDNQDPVLSGPCSSRGEKSRPARVRNFSGSSVGQLKLKIKVGAF